MQSLPAHQTWTLESVPNSVRAIPVKCVYKIKHDSNVNVQRCKARLVAKGCKQQEGVEFDEVFAPVSRYATLQALLAVVAAGDMDLRQVNVETAFLNGVLEEEVWGEQPDGYAEGGPAIGCRLNKALYGLRQAPRAWHMHLTQELLKMGFKPSAADTSLLYATGESGTIHLLIYVDDILIAAHSTADAQKV